MNNIQYNLFYPKDNDQKNLFITKNSSESQIKT